jgi:hypothetical protein
MLLAKHRPYRSWMNHTFELREPDDFWHRRQPKLEKLLMRGPHQFAMSARLPTGESVDVPLARVTFRMLLEGPGPVEPPQR